MINLLIINNNSYFEKLIIFLVKFNNIVEIYTISEYLQNLIDEKLYSIKLCGNNTNYIQN